MSVLSEETKTDIETLIQEYEELLKVTDTIDFINREVEASFQGFHQACFFYIESIRDLDGICENTGKNRKKDLQRSCNLLRKMNFLANNYEGLDELGIFQSYVEDTLNEVRGVPEKICNYALTAVLTLVYIGIAAAVTTGAILICSFTSPAIISGIFLGIVIGALIAYYLKAESQASRISYQFFRPYDLELEKNAVDFMEIAEATWAHRDFENYNGRMSLFTDSF